jgi:hypothetical protein
MDVIQDGGDKLATNGMRTTVHTAATPTFLPSGELPNHTGDLLHWCRFL